MDGFGQSTVGVGGVGDAPVWSLSDAALVEALDAAQVAQVRWAAVAARLVREVDRRGLAAADRAVSTAAWLRERWRISGHSARQVVALGAALDRSPVLDRVVAAGAVHPEQALVIDAAVRRLPVEVGPAVTGRAEATLVGLADTFDPGVLRTLGERILHHVAPEVADRLEAAALARQADRAGQRRGLRLADVGDGLVRLTGWLDHTGAATVTAALDPLCAPTSGDDRTPAQRRADALVDVCALALHTTTLPTNGGDRPQVMVTIPLDLLRHETTTTGPAAGTAAGPGPGTTGTGTTGTGTTGTGTAGTGPAATTGPAGPGAGAGATTGTGPGTGTAGAGGVGVGVGAAVLDTGAPLTVAQARQWACDAGLIPVVLDGAGQVLDLGRTRRLVSGALRRALVLRDGGCSFPGCDRPPRWCDAHHIIPWAQGGTTDLTNTLLVCGHHHRTMHHTTWQARIAPDGRPEFIPPPHLDPHQHPRRNHHHRPP